MAGWPVWPPIVLEHMYDTTLAPARMLLNLHTVTSCMLLCPPPCIGISELHLRTHLQEKLLLGPELLSMLYCPRHVVNQVSGRRAVSTVPKMT